VIEVLRRYRERGLTKPFTTDVLERAGVPASLSRRTLQALKLLGFIDAEGIPNPEFEEASRAPEEQYKERIGELITAAYADVITFADPATDSYDRVRDAFRGYNPRGQQERMVTLFLGLLEFAGLNVATAMTSRKRAEAVTPKKTDGARLAPNKRTHSDLRGGPQGGLRKSARPERGLHDHDESTEGLPPGLVGLLRQIPRQGSGWAASRRKDFLAAFSAVLDFSVPVQEAEPDSAAGSDDEDTKGDKP
jgi:hypothetical protein